MLVVASSHEDAGADARCSVYDGAHHGTGRGGSGGEDWEYERAKPKGRKGGKRGGEEEVSQATGGEVHARERLGGDATMTTTRRTRVAAPSERSVV